MDTLSIHVASLGKFEGVSNWFASVFVLLIPT